MELKEEENARDGQNGTQAFQPYFTIWVYIQQISFSADACSNYICSIYSPSKAWR